MSLSAPPTPINIVTNYTGWCNQHEDRRSDFFDNCPIDRTTTYYFSTSGSDSNDGLTTLTPKQTIAHLMALHDASTGNICFKLKRGDEWRGTTSIIITKANVSIAAYGTGERPFLNFFSLSYSGGGWTADSGDGTGFTYNRPETSDIAFLRDERYRKGDASYGWLIELNTQAAVRTTVNSFAWVSNVLHVNLGGTNPNSITLEALVTGSDSGIELTVDTARCQGIRCDGAGASRSATAGTQKHPFKSSNTGSNAVLFLDCEGYISHTHIFAHYSSSGGRAWYEDCIGGGSRKAIGVAGSSIFNTYAAAGNPETHFYKCTVTHGQYRNYDWSYATDKVQGSAFLSHTAGTDFALLVIRNCTCPTSNQGPHTLTEIGNMPAMSTEWNVTQARGFVVDCRFAQPIENHVPNSCLLGSNTVYYGNKINLKPSLGGVSAMDNNGTRRVHCYLINSLFNLDLTYAGIATGYYCLINGTTGTTGIYLLHTDVLRLGITRSGTAGSGDFDVTTATAGTGVALNSKAFNCIFQGLHPSGGGNTRVGLCNQAASLKNNAYRNMAVATNEGGYSNDANKVDLTTNYTFGTSHAQLLLAGHTGILASHDINGKPRTVSPPDIGAQDYSSPEVPVTPFLPIQQLNIPSAA